MAVRRKVSRKPPERAPDNLIDTFGMCEMEVAALVLIRKAVRVGTWDIAATIEDFSPGLEQDGFLNLLLHGWLKPNLHNPSAHGEFLLTTKFIERVSAKIVQPKQGTGRVVAADGTAYRNVGEYIDSGT